MKKQTEHSNPLPHNLGNDPNKLLEVVLAFNREVDYVNLLNIILTKMMEITSSDAGTLYIIDGGKLHFRILKNNTLNFFKIAKPEDEIDLPPIKLDENNIENVSAYCAIHNEVVVIDDVYEDNRFNFSGPKNYDKMTGYRTRSMLVMPLISSWEGDIEVLGVIQLLNATDPSTGAPTPYGDIYNPPIVLALSKIAANTLANLTHMQEIHQLFHSFVAVMTQAVDERSSTTKYHTQNVAAYCTAFAEYLGETFPQDHPFHFDKRHRERLAIAALLHDIGKIITPAHVLDKSSRLLDQQFKEIKYRFEIKKYQLEVSCLTGCITKEDYSASSADLEKALSLIEHVNSSNPLSDEVYEEVLKLADMTYTDTQGNVIPMLNEDDMKALSIRRGTLTKEEMEVMKDHVAVTGRLLDRITFWKYYRGVSKWARDHHEFLDGSGYPSGLNESEIALETCIITMMDIFDALTATDRPYRKGVPPATAVKILQEMAGEGKLHKELVNVFSESRLWERLVSI